MAIREAVEDPKVAALRETRCLNPHPERRSSSSMPSKAATQRSHSEEVISSGAGTLNTTCP